MGAFEQYANLFTTHHQRKAGYISQRKQKTQRLLVRIEKVQAEYAKKIKETEDLMVQFRDQMYELDPERYRAYFEA